MILEREKLNTKSPEHWQLAALAYPEQDQAAELEAQKLLGNLVLGQTVVLEKVSEIKNSTLAESTKMAKEGDLESRKLIETNVRSDIVERVYKAGHQFAVKLKKQNGKLMQNGRSLVQINLNTFAHSDLNPIMQRRSKTETKNAILFELLEANGVLDTRTAVVFSLTPTDEKTKKEYNFFAETDSVAIQMLSRESEEDFALESAFVAGKKSEDGLRHDFAAIYKLAAEHGVEFLAEDENDVLRFVMLIPKSQTPNGVVDIVKKYDQAVGPGTFYGQAKPTQDYLEYKKICEQRSANFEDIVQRVTKQLIAEADAFDNPIEANLRLNYLVGRLTAEQAVYDETINPNVFGQQSAQHINHARYLLQTGQPMDQIQHEIKQAKNSEKSGSCPFKTDSSGVDFNPENSGENNSTENSSGKKWMHCPFCDAEVYDDPCADKLECWDCKAKVVSGHVKSEGNGGSRARKQRREARQKRAGATAVQ